MLNFTFNREKGREKTYWLKVYFFSFAKMYKDFSTDLTNDNGINRISYKNSLANVVLVKQQGDTIFDSYYREKSTQPWS